MSAMVVMTVLNPSVRTAKMETVVMMPPVFAKLAGKAPPAARRPAKLIVRLMVASAVTATVCALLGLLAFNARPRQICASTTAMAMVSVMNSANNVIVMKIGPAQTAV